MSDKLPEPSLERRAVRAILAGTDLPTNHARQLVGQLSEGEQTTLAALGPRAVPAWLEKRFPPPPTAKEPPAEPAAVEPAPPPATVDEPKPAAEVRRRK